MSEYIITIDDWFFKTVHERYTHFFGCPIKEIVRCRDCRYRMSYWKYDYCDYFNKVVNDPDGFCAWGSKASE